MSYIFLALFVSFLWGLQTVIHKQLLQKLDFITILFISTFVNFSLVVIVALVQKQKILSDLKIITFSDISIIAAVSAFTVFLSNIIYLYVLKSHESSIISALIYSSPVFTLLISYFFLRERLDVYGFLGVCSIILGVILIAQNNPTKIL
jgi:drug/metabolite transporter (DMT)-like permease